jgi:hypothetical protein
MRGDDAMAAAQLLGADEARGPAGLDAPRRAVAQTAAVLALSCGHVQRFADRRFSVRVRLGSPAAPMSRRSGPKRAPTGWRDISHNHRTHTPQWHGRTSRRTCGRGRNLSMHTASPRDAELVDPNVTQFGEARAAIDRGLPPGQRREGAYRMSCRQRQCRVQPPKIRRIAQGAA